MSQVSSAAGPPTGKRRRPVLTGRLVLVVALATLPIAWLGTWFGLLLVNAAIIAAALIDLWRSGRPWDVEVQAPAQVTTRVGTAATFKQLLINRSGSALRLQVRDVWTPSVEVRQPRRHLALSPHGTVVESCAVTPRRGGTIPAGTVALRSRGPWGLAGWQANIPRNVSLLARPAHESARLLPAKLATLTSTEGSVAVRQRGEGTEFDSLREYVGGDDRRSIDWRATARAQRLMVKTWQPERDRRLLVAVDCGRLSAARLGDTARLALFIDALLLLTTVAGYAGDSVDVVAYSRRIRRQVSARGRAGVTGRIGAALTGLEPDMVETDYTGLGSEILRRTRQRQAVVLMSVLSPYGSGDRLLQALRPVASRNPTLLAHVSTPWPALEVDPLSDTYRAAVAARSASRLGTLTQDLGRQGIATQINTTDTFASALTDRYLRWRLGDPGAGWR